MAILAVLDVDDQGTVKVINFKNALDDLDQTHQRVRASAQGMADGAQQAGESLDSLSARVTTLTSGQQALLQNYQTLTQSNQALTQSNQALSQSNQALTQNYQTLIQGNQAVTQSNQTLAQGQQTLTQGNQALAQSSQAVSQSHQQVAQNTEHASASINELSGRVTELFHGIVELSGAGALGLLLKESAEIAARNQTLGVVLSVTAANAKSTTAEYALQVEMVRRLGITTEEASRAVLAFAQSNLKVADTSKVARVAQDLAVVAGMNSSQAFGILTHAIESNQVIMLRQFGIVTGLTQIYGEYARQVGKNVKDLDEMEKKQAFVNKILEEGEKVAGAYEQAMGTAGKQMTSFARFAEEAKAALGQALLPAMYLVVTGANHLLEAFVNLSTEHQRLITAIATGIATILLLSSTLRILSALDLVGFFARAATAVGQFVTAVATANFAALTFSSVLGALVIALGIAAAAYVYFSSKVDINVTALTEHAAATQADIKSLEDLSKKLEESMSHTNSATMSQAEFEKTIRAVAKISPEAAMAIAGMAGSYDEVTLAVRRLTDAQRDQSQHDLQRLQDSKEALTAQRDAAKAEDDRLRAQSTALAERIDRLKKDYDAFVKQGAPQQDLTVFANAIAAAERLKTANTAAWDEAGLGLKKVDGQIATITKSIEGLRRQLDPAFDKLKNAEDIAKMWEEVAAKQNVSLEKIKAQYKQMGIDISKMEIDPTNFRQGMAAFQLASDKAAKAAEADAKKFSAAFESTMDKLLELVPASEGALKAIRKVFFETPADKSTIKSVDDFNDALVRVKSSLEPLEHASEKQKAKWADLVVLWRALQQHLADEKGIKEAAKDAEQAAVRFATLSERIATTTLKFQEMAGQGVEKVRLELGQLVATDLSKLTEMTERAGESVEKITAELTQRNVTAYLSATDQKIAADDKYYRDLQVNIERQIRDIDRVLAAQKRAISEKAEAEVVSLRNTMLNNQAQIDGAIRVAQVKVQAEEIVKAAKPTAAADLADLQARARVQEEAAFQHARAMIGIAEMSSLQQVEVFSKGLNEEKARLQAILASMEGVHATSHQRIIQENSEFWKVMARYPQEFVAIFTHGFVEILEGTLTFKGLFLNLWHSIKSELFRIFDDIINKWLQGVVARMLAGQAAGGAGGWLGITKSLLGMGGGGAAATAGGVGIGETGAVVGLAGSGFGGAAGATASHTIVLGAGASLILAGAAGGLVGFGVGSAIGGLERFQQRPVAASFVGAAAGGAAGAGAGALVGAQIGSIGGPAGALVGLIVGGIAGAYAAWRASHKEEKEVEESRKKFEEQFGGSEQMIQQVSHAYEVLGKTGAEAEAILHRLWDAKGAKEYNAALKEIAAAIDAAKVKEMRDDLIKAAGGMEEFGRKAKLVGFDLTKLYNTKDIKEYNAEVEKLNKLLEEQKKRLDGLNTAAGGLTQLSQGIVQTLAKDTKQIFDTLTSAQRKAFADLLSAAKEKGFTGSDLEFLNLKTTQDALHLTRAQMDALAAAADRVHKSVANMQAAAVGTFFGLLRETGDFVAAMNAISPALDNIQAALDSVGGSTDRLREQLAAVEKERADLLKRQEAGGLGAADTKRLEELNKQFEALKGKLAEVETAGSSAFQWLLDFRKVIKDNEDIANSLSGVTNILKGLSQAGGITQDVLDGMANTVKADFDELLKRGVSQDKAMMLAQPSLQQLWEAQHKFNLKVDEGTQKLIDLGIESGVVGPQMQSDQGKMLDVMLAIAKVLGADLPDYLKHYGDEGEKAGEKIIDRNRHIPPLLDDIGRGADDARGRMRHFGDVGEEAGSDIESGSTDATRGLEEMRRKAAEAQRALEAMGNAGADAGDKIEQGAGRGAEGQSPTGIKQIVLRAQEATAWMLHLGAVSTEVFDTMEQQAAAAAPDDFTVQVVADTSNLTAAQQTLAQFQDRTVTVEADTTAVTAAVAAAQGHLDTLDSKTIGVQVEAQGADTVATLQDQIDSLTGTTIGVMVEANGEAAETLQTRLNQLTGTTLDVGVQVDDASVAALQNLADRPLQLDAQVDTTAVTETMGQLTGKTLDVAVAVPNLDAVTALQDQISSMTGAVLDVTVDTSEVEAAAAAVDQFTGKTVTLGVAVETDAVKTAAAAMEQLTGKTVDVGVQVDTEAVKTAAAALAALEGKDLAVRVETPDSEAVAALQDQIQKLDGKTLDVQVETQGAEKAAALQSAVGDLQGKTLDIGVQVDTPTVDAARRLLAAFPVQVPPVTVTARADEAVAALASVNLGLNQLHDPALTVRTDTQGAQDAMAALHETLTRVPEAQLKVDSRDALEAVSRVSEGVQALPDRDVAVNVLTGPAVASLGQLTGDRTTTVNVDTAGAEARVNALTGSTAKLTATLAEGGAVTGTAFDRTQTMIAASTTALAAADSHLRTVSSAGDLIQSANDRAAQTIGTVRQQADAAASALTRLGAQGRMAGAEIDGGVTRAGMPRLLANLTDARTRLSLLGKTSIDALGAEQPARPEGHVMPGDFMPRPVELRTPRPPTREPGETGPVHIHWTNKVEFHTKPLDGTDMERSVKEKIWPHIDKHLNSNTDQAARRLAAYTNRYRTS